MTGAEKIIDRIMEEARLQSEDNIKRAMEEAAGIIRSAEAEADQKKKLEIDKAKAEAIQVKKRFIAVAELEARKDKLKAKQDIVDEAFQKALDKMCSMPDDLYRKVLNDMIMEHVKDTDGEIILSQKDKGKFGPDFAEGINSRSAAAGKSGKVSISDRTADIRGGFIFKSGDIEINNSFEAILRMKRDELEAEVVKLLF